MKIKTQQLQNRKMVFHVVLCTVDIAGKVENRILFHTEGSLQYLVRLTTNPFKITITTGGQ